MSKLRKTRWAKGVVLALAVAGACVPASADIVVKGTVEIPPEPKTSVPTGADAVRADEQEPATAVVYLEGAPVVGEAPRGTEKLTQRGLRFNPRLLPIYRGTRVEFPNEDDDYHNVFSYSKVKRFDLGRYRKGDTPATQVFEDPGVVKVYCEIHRHMRGVILVLDTPYFVKTEPTGAYELVLPDLPAGRYTLTAWLNENQKVEKEIELSPGSKKTVDFVDHGSAATLNDSE